MLPQKASPVAQVDLRQEVSMCHLSLELQQHAVVRLQAHAGTQHILQHRSLLAKGVNDWSALGHNRCLCHNTCMSAADSHPILILAPGDVQMLAQADSADACQ